MARSPVRLRQEFYLDPQMGFNCFQHWQSDMLWHDHDFFEVAVVLTGNGYHKTLTEKKKIKRGDVIFMNTEEPHAYQLAEPLEIVNLLIGKAVLHSVQNLLPEGPFLEASQIMAFMDGKPKGSAILSLPHKHWIPMRKAVDGLVQAYPHRHGGQMPLVRLRFAEVLYHMARGTEARPAGEVLKDESEERITGAIEFMNREYTRPIELAELAHRSGYHPAYFSSLFKKHTGYSPMEYLIDLRVQKACFLLKYGEEPVTEVARLTGFSQVSLFYRIFKRVTGMSPKAFRVIRGEEVRKQKQMKVAD